MMKVFILYAKNIGMNQGMSFGFLRTNGIDVMIIVIKKMPKWSGFKE